jgi:hypothetical protein
MKKARASSSLSGKEKGERRKRARVFLHPSAFILKPEVCQAMIFKEI